MLVMRDDDEMAVGHLSNSKSVNTLKGYRNYCVGYVQLQKLWWYLYITVKRI